MILIAERVDALFGTRGFFITTRATKGRIKPILIQRLLERLGFHDIGVFGAAVVERVDIGCPPLFVGVHDQFHTRLFSHAVTELDHFAKLPRGVHVHQREWRCTGVKSFARQVQHYRRIFTDGVHHHRVGELSGNFTDDMDRLGF